MKAGTIMKQGWKCPQCTQIWAPFISECLNCNFTRNPISSLSEDISPQKDFEIMKEEPVTHFLQGPQKGKPFNSFPNDRLSKFIELAKKVTPKSKELEFDLENLTNYLKSKKD